MGRVIGVFGKDIDSEYPGMALPNYIHSNTHLDIDNQLPGESLINVQWMNCVITINWLTSFSADAYVLHLLVMRLAKGASSLFDAFQRLGICDNNHSHRTLLL